MQKSRPPSLVGGFLGEDLAFSVRFLSRHRLCSTPFRPTHGSALGLCCKQQCPILFRHSPFIANKALSSFICNFRTSIPHIGSFSSSYNLDRREAARKVSEKTASCKQRPLYRASHMGEQHPLKFPQAQKTPRHALCRGTRRECRGDCGAASTIYFIPQSLRRD